MKVGLEKGRLLYEGKAKKMFAVAEAGRERNDWIWVEFKDSLTAFNAQKKGSFEEKGAVNRKIASLIFRLLEKNEVPSHWIKDVGENEMVCRKLEMIPLEVVVRNVMAGSLAKRLGKPEGTELPRPLVEFYYKDDKLEDPFINDDHALILGAARDAGELEKLRKAALKINSHLGEIFAAIGIRLVDFKLEFGRDASGEVVLADEITPDSCRLWDVKTQDKMDKDRFRRDLGRVDEVYREVLSRLEERWLKTLNA